jgi:hypothetical protein
MDESMFLDILMENKPEAMMKFLLENGKKPKPICPIYFIKNNKEECKNE